MGMGMAFLLISCKDSTSSVESREDLLTREEINELEKERIAERRGEDGTILLTEGEFAGMKLFMRHCNRCHPGGEKGKGPALNDKKLPDFLIHFQVRQGMGDMPAFKKDQLSKGRESTKGARAE